MSTQSPKEPSGWENLKSVWRELIRGEDREKTSRKARPAELREQITACLEGQGGEVSARQRAAQLARDYITFSSRDRLAFLKLLNDEFGADQEEIDHAVRALQSASDPSEKEKLQRHLRQALEPARLKLLRQFNMFQSGARFIVELRRELVDLLGEHPELKPLERDIKELLATWFDVGFLELQQITWHSPASLLEKLGRYEAVHPMRGWLDLKNRLESDRRCFAFFHPCMEDEPLIFIEVALVNGLADNIQHLLDDKKPPMDPDEANTAIFYSISNTQRGLNGISFGSFLIKQVVDELQRAHPKLKRFATLSPIPGFRRWLDARLDEGDLALPAYARKPLRALSDTQPAHELIRDTLSDTRWHRDEQRREAVKPALLALCANYLLNAKRRDGKQALDPVAHFHLTNGARMQRLNWLADTSTRGMADSAGMMINYLYRLDWIERFHEEYTGEGEINASSTITGLLK